MKAIPQLKQGDVVRILAPGKAIDKKYVEDARERLEAFGFRVQISEYCLDANHYFSGTIVQRTQDLQNAIDAPSVKAILCARGGYGCIQIVDRINWADFMQNPKWMIGFSDITVFHQRLSRMQCPSLHATMPLNFNQNSERSITSLVGALKGEALNYRWKTNAHNKKGMTQGHLIGGNLAVLCGLIGTNEMPSYLNSILFVEEVGEPLYAIDRYFYQLSKAGVLDQIRGIVLGGFSGTKDSDPPYGMALEEIVRAHFEYRSIPVAFDFPGGHQDDNCALILGRSAVLSVEDEEVQLKM
ncbi:MAG: S66 peptidase family protein [Bacteroidota bacterium]